MNEFIGFEDSLINNTVKFQIMLTKPSPGKRSILSYRYLHCYLNGRPVETTKRFKAIFY